MALRERLTERLLDPGLPAVHLTLGLAVAMLVVLVPSHVGGPSPHFGMANRIAAGDVAYRDFPVEYPPLGLLHIFLPRLLGGPTLQSYELWFTLVSLALAVATAAAVLWLARRGWSAESPANTILILIALALAGTPLVLWRFDILPTMFTALGLVAYALGQNAWTGVALGLGTAAKLFPAFLGPVFFLARLMERRFVAAAALFVGAAVTVLAIALEVYSVAGLNGFSYLLYQEERGVQIESVAGGLALLADALGIRGARIFFDFGSFQVASSMLGRLALPLRIVDLILIGILIAAAAWSFRRDVRMTGRVAPSSLVAYLVATLLVVILTNKVLSPQYVVWLLPFGALLPRSQSLLLVVIVALTTLIYPFAYDALLDIETPVVIALNVRNALLVVLFAWVVWPRGLSLARRGAEAGASA